MIRTINQSILLGVKCTEFPPLSRPRVLQFKPPDFSSSTDPKTIPANAGRSVNRPGPQMHHELNWYRAG